MKTCALAECGAAFEPAPGQGSSQRFCCTKHRRRQGTIDANAKLMAERKAAREAKRCLDCGASLADRIALAKRCAPCSAAFRRAEQRALKATPRYRQLQAERAAKRRRAAGIRPRAFRAPGERAAEPRVAKAPEPKASKAAKAVVAAQSTKQADEAAARKAAMELKPNMRGDWFPGWDGHYPPSFTALERELLDSGRGRVFTDSEKFGRKHQWPELGEAT